MLCANLAHLGEGDLGVPFEQLDYVALVATTAGVELERDQIRHRDDTRPEAGHGFGAENGLFGESGGAAVEGVQEVDHLNLQELWARDVDDTAQRVIGIGLAKLYLVAH